ncbi:hypothetical protein [Taklimakanibacter deserti]|uniref:hypothetical protein n=1 Tax=Taklimakanibacter deserti TaxID=2267839 RepID=UPI0013C4E24E
MSSAELVPGKEGHVIELIEAAGEFDRVGDLARFEVIEQDPGARRHALGGRRSASGRPSIEAGRGFDTPIAATKPV